MKLNYKGATKDNENRLAEISFAEAEEKVLDRIITLMNIKGWKYFSVCDEYACHEVEDMEEYRYFMRDWKEAKKCIVNCERFGF